LNLAIRDSLKCRRLIESEWYQSLWADTFRIASDQNVKSRYENDKTGARVVTSTDAGTTGEKGDVLAIDDPHNVSEVESDTMRGSVIRWFDEARPAPTRCVTTTEKSLGYIIGRRRDRRPMKPRGCPPPNESSDPQRPRCIRRRSGPLLR
jgi:hypothetical protein